MNYIFSAIFLYFFLGFLLYIFQRRIVFNKSGHPGAPKDYNLDNTEEVYIKTEDNLKLLSWYHKGNNSLPLLVYFHGNSFDIGERAYRIKKYNDSGFSTLIVSWRGFSGNDGDPSEKNLYLDGKATIEWILNNTHHNCADIVNYGESLGTGVAVELNLKYDFCLTVLEAPFTSIADVAKKRYRIYPTKFLVKDKFDNYKKIVSIKSPLLIISGKEDEVVPHSHSLKLYERAKVEKKSLFIDEAMHNNLYDYGIEKTVINFTLKLWK